MTMRRSALGTPGATPTDPADVAVMVLHGSELMGGTQDGMPPDGGVEVLTRPNAGMPAGASTRPGSPNVVATWPPNGEPNFPSPRNAGPWTPPQTGTPRLGLHDTRRFHRCPSPYHIRSWTPGRKAARCSACDGRDTVDYPGRHGHGQNIEGDREDGGIRLRPGPGMASHGPGVEIPEVTVATGTSGTVDRWTSHPRVAGRSSATSIIS